MEFSITVGNRASERLVKCLKGAQFKMRFLSVLGGAYEIEDILDRESEFGGPTVLAACQLRSIVPVTYRLVDVSANKRGTKALHRARDVLGYCMTDSVSEYTEPDEACSVFGTIVHDMPIDDAPDSRVRSVLLDFGPVLVNEPDEPETIVITQEDLQRKYPLPGG